GGWTSLPGYSFPPGGFCFLEAFSGARAFFCAPALRQEKKSNQTPLRGKGLSRKKKGRERGRQSTPLVPRPRSHFLLRWKPTVACWKPCARPGPNSGAESRPNLSEWLRTLFFTPCPSENVPMLRIVELGTLGIMGCQGGADQDQRRSTELS